MRKCKNEYGHVYGDWVVIDKIDLREPSNGCVKWLCQCRYCGEIKIMNGNNLRFNNHGHCRKCRERRR